MLEYFLQSVMQGIPAVKVTLPFSFKHNAIELPFVSSSFFLNKSFTLF